MCGIAGIVARRRGVDLESGVREMIGRIRHRGPDDGGFSTQGRVALGNCRLSVIDLSASGHQPMEYANGRYVITYNGEVYNYREIRAELQTLGLAFRSRSDTEVVVAAYSAWGPSCLSRFNGMWAFAIHDRELDVVFAARDRFGVKPFHYVLTEACFAFGSEIRQLLPLLPAVNANLSAVRSFILAGVQSATAETFFEGVATLLPGHVLQYNVASDQVEIEPWYDLLERVADRGERSGPDAVVELRSALEDAVRLRLRLDVRGGACLSGGIDSSSIALMAAQLHSRSHSSPFVAVTAISEDPRTSEESHAGVVVRAGSLEWVKTRPTYDQFRELLPHVVKHQEEPFASPSVCMQAFVMKAASESGLTVLLDGQGGDETLLGYDEYYAAYCAALWREGGARAMLHGWQMARQSNSGMTCLRLAGLLVHSLCPGVRGLHYRRRASYLTGRPPLPDWIGQFASASLDVRQLQALEIGTTSLPALLRYADRNSMAFSIEGRLPFLDYRLVETSLALAMSLKIHDGWTKWALRQAMSDLLPNEIAWRRDKIAFAAPAEKWLGQHMHTMTETVRKSPLIRRFCDIDKLMRRYQRLDRNSQWRLYSLAAWEREFGVCV